MHDVVFIIKLDPLQLQYDVALTALQPYTAVVEEPTTVEEPSSINLLHVTVSCSFLVKLDQLGHCPRFYLTVVIIRNRLSYEQFGAFLANVKELNSHKQTKEVIHPVSALLPLILSHQPRIFS